MLRCSDNSLYTGITNDFEKRYQTHISQRKDAAKYTKSRKVVSVVARWEIPTRSGALKMEIRIKKLPKAKKEMLVQNPESIDDIVPDIEGILNYPQI